MKSPTVKGGQPASTGGQSFFNKPGSNTFFDKGKSATFFNPGSIQTSLTVGQPDDPFEKEADKVSRQVVDGFDQASTIQRQLSGLGLQQLTIQPYTIGSRISRKLQKTLSRTPLFVQARCSQCEEEEKMQQKSGSLQFAGGGSPVPSDIEKKIQSMRGGGQAIDDKTLVAMESSFGADFSSVRVHTNSQAVQMSRELNAHAFTVGNDIFFNEGRYQPQSKQGAGLLAHELTHTVQQGASVQSKRINRLPYAQLFSNSSIAHLSSLKGHSVQQAALYRKEIAQFQKEVPEEEMMMQQQILQTKKMDQVQMKDNSKSLRRCIGGCSGSGCATPKARKAKLKSGPTYTPNGTIVPIVKPDGSKTATFTMAAEFENDPTHDIYPACGQVRQYIKWSSNADRPKTPDFSPESSFPPNTWYEDRFSGNKRYGHRSGASSFSSNTNRYLNSAAAVDMINGEKYAGLDTPTDGSGLKTGSWDFRLEAIDVCDGNKVLGTDSLTVDW
ncbi:MAG: hypothetical protein C0490_10905 [Marivirga sp.]|nr:hypothetical protein [Marivirga sp.]